MTFKYISALIVFWTLVFIGLLTPEFNGSLAHGLYVFGISGSLGLWAGAT